MAEITLFVNISDLFTFAAGDICYFDKIVSGYAKFLWTLFSNIVKLKLLSVSRFWIAFIQLGIRYQQDYQYRKGSV